MGIDSKAGRSCPMSARLLCLSPEDLEAVAPLESMVLTSIYFLTTQGVFLDMVVLEQIYDLFIDELNLSQGSSSKINKEIGTRLFYVLDNILVYFAFNDCGCKTNACMLYRRVLHVFLRSGMKPQIQFTVPGMNPYIFSGTFFDAWASSVSPCSMEQATIQTPGDSMIVKLKAPNSTTMDCTRHLHIKYFLFNDVVSCPVDRAQPDTNIVAAEFEKVLVNPNLILNLDDADTGSSYNQPTVLVVESNTCPLGTSKISDNNCESLPVLPEFDISQRTDYIFGAFYNRTSSGNLNPRPPNQTNTNQPTAKAQKESITARIQPAHWMVSGATIWFIITWLLVTYMFPSYYYIKQTVYKKNPSTCESIILGYLISQKVASIYVYHNDQLKKSTRSILYYTKLMIYGFVASIFAEKYWNSQNIPSSLYFIPYFAIFPFNVILEHVMKEPINKIISKRMPIAKRILGSAFLFIIIVISITLVSLLPGQKDERYRSCWLNIFFSRFLIHDTFLVPILSLKSSYSVVRKEVSKRFPVIRVQAKLRKKYESMPSAPLEDLNASEQELVKNYSSYHNESNLENGQIFPALMEECKENNYEKPDDIHELNVLPPDIEENLEYEEKPAIIESLNDEESQQAQEELTINCSKERIDIKTSQELATEAEKLAQNDAKVEDMENHEGLVSAQQPANKMELLRFSGSSGHSDEGKDFMKGLKERTITEIEEENAENQDK